MTNIKVRRGTIQPKFILVSDRAVYMPLTVAEARAVAAELIRLADEIDAEHKDPAP